MDWDNTEEWRGGAETNQERGVLANGEDILRKVELSGKGDSRDSRRLTSGEEMDRPGNRKKVWEEEQ